MGERKRETVKERETERKREECERERKTYVPKLYAYNECEHSVLGKRLFTVGPRYVSWINTFITG